MNSPILIEKSSEAVITQFLDPRQSDAFIAALLEENKRVNLVSRETSANDLRRLVAESLLPLLFLKEPVRKYLDIGSGGGLPAIPLLLALVQAGERPDAILMEPRQKKSAALRRICLGLKLNPEIIKEPFPQHRPDSPVDLITIRLVKLTPAMLATARDVLDPDGALVYYGPPDTSLNLSQNDYHSIAYRIDNTAQTKSLTIIAKN